MLFYYTLKDMPKKSEGPLIFNFNFCKMVQIYTRLLPASIPYLKTASHEAGVFKNGSKAGIVVISCMLDTSMHHCPHLQSVFSSHVPIRFCSHTHCGKLKFFGRFFNRDSISLLTILESSKIFAWRIFS